MIVRAHSEFVAVRSTDFPQVDDLRTFRRSSFAHLVIEPDGKMAMPARRVANRAADDHTIHQPAHVLPDGKLPFALNFPRMTITTLENAYCLPFGPPILEAQRQIITDFLIPWAPGVLGWFAHAGDKLYRFNVDVNMDHIIYDIDTAFYMDHSVSGHYGHFIADCLSRIYGWDVCRELFGKVKVIVADGAEPDFQTHLLIAAGVPARDIVKISNLAYCRRLLLATPSVGVERYASPTSARLWGSIRDRSAVRDLSLPDRIYLSRSGIKDRKLLNEADVERMFERHGFKVVRPETLRVDTQIALLANALLVAGPCGSSMFNLAFQGRMRSAFLLAREDVVQLSEMLLSAGRSCDLCYHLGQRAFSETLDTERGSWVVDLARLESDVADWVVEAGR